jgi:hypothetical protein
MKTARLMLGVLLFAHAPAFAQECRTIDFDTDASGAPVAPATVITDQYEAWGVVLSYVSQNHGPLFTFDSSAPTGNDDDLGSPNQGCTTPGPGDGNGADAGEFNCYTGEGDGRVPPGGLGNLLIIQDDKANSPLTVPDDSAQGGTITFEFDRDVVVRQVNFLDDITGTTRLFDTTDTEIGTLTYGTTRDNGYYPFSLPTPDLNVGDSFTGDNTGVRRLEVEFRGSGGIAGVEVCGLPGAGGAPVPPSIAVPASSPWALGTLAAMLAFFGVAAFRRRA